MNDMGIEELQVCLQDLEEQIASMEGMQWEDIETVLNGITEDIDRGLHGRACYCAAYFMLFDGRTEDALEYLNESVRCMIGTSEEKEVSRCYNMFGIIAHSQNNLHLALEQYETALAYAEKYDNKMDYNIVLGNLADAFYRFGAYEQAVKCYEECLKNYDVGSASKENDIVNYRKIVASYGYCLLMLERLEQATRVADYLLAMSCSINCELATRLSVYTFLAFLYYRKNEKQREKLALRIALDFAQDLEQISSECDVLLNLIDFLCYSRRMEDLAELIHDLEGKAAVEQNAGFFLQLLSVHMRYFGDGMDTNEFRQNAEMFFCVKEECEKTVSMQIMQMMELRTRLQQIEEEQHKLESVNSQLMYQVEHDELSGLCNRGSLNRHLEKVFEEAVQKQKVLTILFFDIDFFKQMNDYYGHKRGDDCIVALADSLRECMYEDFIARYGGDEFVVVMYDRSRDYVERKVNALLQNVRNKAIPHEMSTVSDVMTVTVGIVHDVPKKQQRVWEFLTAADIALYQQKKEHKGRARFYEVL